MAHPALFIVLTLGGLVLLWTGWALLRSGGRRRRRRARMVRNSAYPKVLGLGRRAAPKPPPQ